MKEITIFSWVLGLVAFLYIIIKNKYDQAKK
jgi:hypothetical protein